MSNLKQLGIGVMMYTQDYDEKYPMESSLNGPTPPDGYLWSSTANLWFWPQIIYPYTRSDQVAVCPSSPRVQLSGGKPIPYTSNYGANSMVMRDGDYLTPGSGVSVISLAAVNHPSETYLVMDGSWWRMPPNGVITPQSGYGWLPGSGDLGLTFVDNSWSSPPSDWQTGRHFDGVNMTFADGHVKWLKSSVVYIEAKNCPVSMGYTTPPTNASAWNPYAP